ncbi:hypothetical protein DM02DRAFT_659491 [Periconia macrospinosa]|uniref:Cytochrome P450 n=1 Tax=Periconia macrospinosa TaxID=97972 RepID=A0A2V1DDN6_9PLEO|nr:hypothetical protein DM02DRAFT_659491 [Periconia macrospinosa]
MPLVSFLTSFCGAAALIVCFLFYTWSKTPRGLHQPKEVPPTIPIPFIGHAIGLWMWRNHYYTKISQQWNLPIILLPMLGANVYVSKSPELLYSIQRQPKSLSFWYFEAQFTSRLGKLSHDGTEGSFRGVLPESTGDCPVIDCLKGVKMALSVQGDLNKMSQVALQSFGEGVVKLVQEKGVLIDLEAWVKHKVMLASTDAAYGPKNSFSDHAIADAFW